MNHKPLFLAVTLVALLIIGGVFWVMEKRPVATHQSVVTKPVAEAPIQTEPEKYPQHIETIPGDTDEVWYNIPELGIRMKLNKEFAEDLVYEPDSSYSGVSFQKKSVLAVASHCTVEDADFGYLYKIKGTIEGADKKNLSERGNNFFASLRQYNMILQLSGFFVALSTDRADACWWGTTENKEAEEAAKKKYNGAGNQSVWDVVKNKNVQIISEKQ